MGDFAIVAEGITDQVVLRSLILAYHDDREPEPIIVFEQPPLDTTGAAGLDPEPGGWTLIIKYLRDRKYLQALQLNQYVVVHIDTDIAADLGVARLTSTTDDELVELVVAKLSSCIAEQDRSLVEGRILFAIGVDEIECWLLSAVFDPSEKSRLAKTTGCLEAIDQKLVKSNLAPLSSPLARPRSAARTSGDIASCAGSSGGEKTSPRSATQASSVPSRSRSASVGRRVVAPIDAEAAAPHPG